jgi:hypothetical protein
MTDPLFKQFDEEAEIVGRLDQHCVDRPDGPYAPRIFEGETNRAIRKERLRAAILEAKVNSEIFNRMSRETFAERFERVYSEPLEPKKGD